VKPRAVDLDGGVHWWRNCRNKWLSAHGAYFFNGWVKPTVKEGSLPRRCSLNRCITLLGGFLVAIEGAADAEQEPWRCALIQAGFGRITTPVPAMPVGYGLAAACRSASVGAPRRPGL
jgi:hypothetical protein